MDICLKMFGLGTSVAVVINGKPIRWNRWLQRCQKASGLRHSHTAAATVKVPLHVFILPQTHTSTEKQFLYTKQ